VYTILQPNVYSQMALTLAVIEAFQWFGAWEAITNDVERQFLETELTTTLHVEHILYKRPITAVARRTDTDDVLFLVRGSVVKSSAARVELAEVHLSYSAERTPDFPHCILFESLEAWKEAALREDERLLAGQ
jgi:hypothetical protein